MVSYVQSPAQVSAPRSSAVIASTIPLYAISSSTGAANSGVLYISRVWLYEGQQISDITWLTGSTEGLTLSHGWAAILNASYLQLAHSADVTSGDLAAETFITWPLTEPWTVPATGFYWVGFMVAASTQPSAAISNSQSAAGFAAFPLTGPATTGLGAPGTDGTTTYEAPTAAAGTPYIDLS